MSLKYMLITPAYNEETYIEQTIKVVVCQTILPDKWIIISDGSTDRTNEIVKKYVEKNEWIELIELPEHGNRNFASKVHAFNKGYEKIKDLEYDIICCLDADITFDNDYFEFLLEKYAIDPELGVAGTDYVEGDFHSYHDSYINKQHVNGGCQLFRKECFESIDGYQAIEDGGIDWVAVTTARMKGWKTNSFSERVFYHHREIGTAEASSLKSRFNYGKKDYFLGGHPLWEVFRSLFQMTKKPYIVGGMTILSGYVWLFIKRKKRPVSKELMQFYRNEQMERLKGMLKEGFTR
jgi:glycosyltransferase involved in cell wall biosynthesis